MPMPASARPESGASGLSRIIDAAPLVIFLGMLIYIGFNAPNFMSFGTMQLVLNQSVPVVVVCLGLSIVVMAGGDDVVSGGIDLSIPATAVICAGIIAQLVTNTDTPLLLAIALALGAAMFIGIVAGLMVTRLGMTPLLTTLALFVAVVGVTKVVTSSRRINVDDPFIIFLRDGEILGISAGVVITLALVLVFYHFIHRTKWGLNLQAVGGSCEAAEISGLKPGHFLFWAFVIAAFTGFLASFFLLARGSGSSPGTENNLMLEMVLATFLGAAFSPRRVVTLWGAVLGAVLVAALSIGFKTMGVNVFWTGLIKGSLILVVLALAALSSRVKS
ncbi:MAG TPA: ABC transporter permease [Devosia sp.]|nr:ABC transporter permease [Devosia sp.]